MDKTYDVAIVGSGLAGLFAARQLAEHGLSVALLDRMTSPLCLELAFSMLALPPFRDLAEEIFFRRGSFPDPGPIPTNARPESPSLGP